MTATLDRDARRSALPRFVGRRWRAVAAVIEAIVDALTALVARLPRPIARLLPRELVGYTVLSMTTFALDVVLLTALREFTPMALPAAIGLAYLVAFGVNYVLNRVLTFHSHAPVGPQVSRFVVVVLVDLALTIGVTTGLVEAGLDMRLARFVSGGIVGLLTFLACRFWVFRDTLPGATVTPWRGPTGGS